MKTLEVLLNLKIFNECECDSVLVSRIPILGLCITLDENFLNPLTRCGLRRAPQRRPWFLRLNWEPGPPGGHPPGAVMSNGVSGASGGWVSYYKAFFRVNQRTTIMILISFRSGPEDPPFAETENRVIYSERNDENDTPSCSKTLRPGRFAITAAESHG
jgi:hypothetical protein